MTQFSSVQFQDGMYALGKAHMRSTPRLSGVSPSVVAFETVPMLV